MAVQPAQGGAGSLVADGGADQLSGHRRRYRAVAGHGRRRCRAAQQRLVGQHQVHRDGLGDRRGPPGDPLDQGVGHHLAPAAAVAAGVGGSLECGVDRHALRERKQRGEVGHAVRCRPDRDRAFALGPGGPIHHRVRIQPVGDRLGVGRDAPVAQALQPATVGAQFGVQRPAVLDVQAGAFPDDQGGPPFRERSGIPTRPGCGASRAPGLWRTRGAGLRGPENRGGPARSRRPPRGPASSDRRPRGCFGGRSGRLERRRGTGLRGRGGGLQSFQSLDPRDECRFISAGVDGEQFFEHAFDIRTCVRQNSSHRLRRS